MHEMVMEIHLFKVNDMGGAGAVPLRSDVVPLADANQLPLSRLQKPKFHYADFPETFP